MSGKQQWLLFDDTKIKDIKDEEQLVVRHFFTVLRFFLNYFFHNNYDGFLVGVANECESPSEPPLVTEIAYKF